MRTYMAFLGAAAAFAAPPAAQASAGGLVTAVAAELDVRQPEQALVKLALRVRVETRWLASLEVDGLDPDAGPVEVATAPEQAPPEVLREAPGRLRLVWSDRRTAPPPGEHEIQLAYTTRQLSAAGSEPAPHHLAWTLPRWSERVAGAQIRVIGPAGLTPLPAAEPNLGLSVAVERTPPSITFTRVELPRTEAWRVSFALPPTAASASLPLAQLRAAGFAELQSAIDASAWPCLLGVCLGLVVVAKRRSRRREAAAAALVPSLDAPRFDGLSFALCALSAALLQEAPSLALACALAGVASGLERGDRSEGRQACDPAADGGKGPRWFDATTAAGATLLAALYVAGWLTPEPVRGAALTCVWLATPLFFSRTRLHAR